MMLLFSFITFLSTIQITISLQNEYISYLNKNLNQKELFNAQSPDGLAECLVIYNKNKDIMNATLCVLTKSLNDSEILGQFIQFFKFWIDANIESTTDEKTLKFYKLFNNLYENGFINNLIEVLLNNTSIIENIIILIEEAEKENTNYQQVWECIYLIFKIEKFQECLETFYENYKDEFLDLLDLLFSQYETIGNIYNILRTDLIKYQDEILRIVYNVIKSHYNRTIVIESAVEFIMKYNETIPIIKKFLNSSSLDYAFTRLIPSDDPLLIAIQNTIIQSPVFLDLMLEVLDSPILIKNLSTVLLNLNDDDYIKDRLPDIIDAFIKKDKAYIDNINQFMLALMINLYDGGDLYSRSTSTLQKKIAEIFLQENVTSYNITHNCLNLFNYTYFDYNKKDKELFQVYLQKVLLDSSRNKANFLTFDTCLALRNESLTKDYIIYPTFFIGIINNPEDAKNYKKTSFYLKSNYIISFCLPFGFKNEEEEKNNQPLCNKNDYNEIIRFLSNFYSNVENMTIDNFYLYKQNVLPTAHENFFGILSLIILLLPVIIYLLLILTKNIIINNQINNINNIKKLEDEKTKKSHKNESFAIQANKSHKKVKFPRWYNYLKSFFNIVKNGKELFNFNLNNLNFNDVNGITYIKGLYGFSILLNIFGQTFISLINLPVKEYGIFDFYKIMKDVLYSIFFIGYKYCPRILFSCSGYILTYKYLCYIEQEQGLYFLKFIFLQSYKYLLLILDTIFCRQFIYFISLLFKQSKRPGWEIFRYFNRAEDFYKKFFSFLLYIEENGNNLKQNLIFYFYLPINEVFFFLFGIILISLGYKFKLRIDIFIFVLILIIFLFRAIYFLAYLYPKCDFYSTIDYYLFDFGISLINPYFNLSSFLIGMYFGLINYSIQKGITNLYKNKNDHNVINLRLISDYSISENEDEVLVKSNTLQTNEKNNNLGFKSINDGGFSDQVSPECKNNKIRNSIRPPKNSNQKIENIIRNNINENLDNLFLEENIEENGSNKELSENIKRMPFLIWPIKFANLHRKNINKCSLKLFITISVIILIFFLYIEILLISMKMNIDENPQDKSIISELSFSSIIPNSVLNIFYSIDIEIIIFIIQWLTFILYFKQIEIIQGFLNHVYWSIFVKCYFTYSLVSIPVILFVFYETETVVKLSIFNLVLYSFMNLILILILMIIFYSCLELPLKKIFKFFLKGKEILNLEDDDDDEDEDSDEDEGQYLKDK